MAQRDSLASHRATERLFAPRKMKSSFPGSVIETRDFIGSERETKSCTGLRERQTERKRQTDRQKATERQTDTDTQRGSASKKQRDRDRQTDRGRDRDRNRQRKKDRERHTQTDR